jgi:uncharacterized protein (DUF427 family)
MLSPKQHSHAALSEKPAQIEIIFAGKVIAASTNYFLSREITNDSIFFIPRNDVIEQLQFIPSSRKPYCHFRGLSAWYHLHYADTIAANAAWTYPNPGERYTYLKDHIAFKSSLMDVVILDGRPAEKNSLMRFADMKNQPRHAFRHQNASTFQPRTSYEN